MRRPALHHRLLGAVFDAYVLRTLGYPLPFAAELLDTYGTDFLSWSERLGDVRDDALASWGQVTGDMVIAIAATSTGCQWCSKGHLLGANLGYLRDTGRLYPLDERHIDDWQQLRDVNLVDTLTQRLTAGGELGDAALVRRLFALRNGAESAEHADDALLVRIIAAWDLLTECTIVAELPGSVPAIDPELSRADALLARYRALRAA